VAVAECGVADEIGRHCRLPFAVVAVDAGRTLVELDVGDDGERHAAAFAALAERHAQLLQHLQIAAREVLELDTDRHLTVAASNLGERRADVADGGDADGLRQAFGGDAEARRKLGARTDPQFGPVERGFRDHVGDDRKSASSGSRVRSRHC